MRFRLSQPRVRVRPEDLSVQLHDLGGRINEAETQNIVHTCQKDAEQHGYRPPRVHRQATSGLPVHIRLWPRRSWLFVRPITKRKGLIKPCDIERLTYVDS